MQIVLDGTNHRQRKRANKRLERFHTLRERLKRKKREVARFEADMDALMGVYRTQVLPVEAEEVAPLSRLAERLIVFMSRKSLGERDRSELAEWFWETLRSITAFEPQVADELAQRFQETVARYAGLTMEQFTALREEVERDEASVHEWHDDEAPELDDEQPDLFGFDDPFLGGDWDEAKASQAQPDGPSAASVVDPERLINGEWIRGLFRRTAQALHPDRELDPHKRQDKHTLMARLLDARKNEDVLTILELYSEHVSGGVLQAADAELDVICQLIQRRIDALDAQKQDTLYGNPIYHTVFELLHGKSKRARERKLDTLIRDIRERIDTIDALVGELRNLDCLRHVLRERRYAHFELEREVEALYDIFEHAAPFRDHPPF